jgi:hypothetical protein
MKKLIAIALLTASTLAMAEIIIYLPPEGGIQTCIISEGGVITCI